MRKKYRLRGRRNFLTVYNQGRTWANELLVLKALANGLPHNRYAFAVGRRLGKAVVRNRLRRRLREGVRSLTLAGGWDVIVVARRPAVVADYHRLQAAAASVLQRASMLVVTQPVGGGGGGRR
ncbi:MAG: ribonuclease P protein component [Dehalococcoidia bacterium]